MADTSGWALKDTRAAKETMAAWRRWSPAVWAAFRRGVVGRSASPVRGLRADLVEPSWIPIGGPVGPVGAKYQRTRPRLSWPAGRPALQM